MLQSSEETFDIVVIGAGPVGENAADRAVRGGLSALLIESELVGGECSYWACMPSKALIRPATALKAAKNVAGSREASRGELDVDAVLKRRDSFAAHWQDDGQVSWVKDAGIALRRGQAKLLDERLVRITDSDGEQTVVRAKYAVVLATGSVPVFPEIPGLADTDFWGTREATSAQQVPTSLTVIGGGVAGTELAQIYARLGAQVVQLVRGEVLAQMPEAVRKIIRESLRTDGVDLREHTSPQRIERDGDFRIHLDSETLRSEELLIATGRRPAIAGIGLEDLLSGESADRNEAEQISQLRTDDTGLVAGTDWLYAVGDAAGKVLLTHQGKYEARITGAVLAARAADEQVDPAPWSAYAQTANEYAVPSVVFTDPEVATVGRSLERARDEGVDAVSVELPIAVAGSSLYQDDYEGWAQLVLDRQKRTLVGATFAGAGVAELLHSVTIAIVGEVTVDRLWHAVPAYPTISEVWLRLLEELDW